MKKLTDYERWALSILPIGAENARTSKELQRRHNIKNRRKLCSTINSLRLKGFAIGSIRSASGGYFWCKSEEERDNFIKQYEAQIRDEMNVVYMMQTAKLASDY